VAIASMAMVAAMAQVADAQREGRGRGGRGFGRGGGFGPMSTVQLATLDEVQAALNLSEEQKDKVKDIDDKLRQDRRDLFQEGGGNFREMRAEMEKLSQEASTQLAEVLDETQNKRLLGILAQVDVGAALDNAAIATELSITDEQKTRLREARDSNWQAMRDARDEIRDQDLSREEMRAKFNELRTEAEKKLLAVLTSEQQAQLEALKGEPVEIDLSQLRRGRGGEGRRGRDRDRDRERAAAEASETDA
jgi:Spy/CpxP family protein refolding chaperone